MSQTQYTAIAKTRLTDLHTIELGLLKEYLEGKPAWLIARVLEIHQQGGAA